MSLRLNKSLTLLELLIAIGLITIVVLAFASVQIFSNFHLATSGRQVQLQNESYLALEHMRKNIIMAIGDISDLPVRPYDDNRGIRIRIDSNGDGRVDPADTWIGYRHEGSQILFFPSDSDGSYSGDSEVIANHIVITQDPTSPESAANPWGLKIDMPAINQFNITVKARWVPDSATPVSLNNPEVVLTASIIAPTVSTK